MLNTRFISVAINYLFIHTIKTLITKCFGNIKKLLLQSLLPGCHWNISRDTTVSSPGSPKSSVLNWYRWNTSLALPVHVRVMYERAGYSCLTYSDWWDIYELMPWARHLAIVLQSRSGLKFRITHQSSRKPDSGKGLIHYMLVYVTVCNCVICWTQSHFG